MTIKPQTILPPGTKIKHCGSTKKQARPVRFMVRDEENRLAMLFSATKGHNEYCECLACVDLYGPVVTK